MFYKKITYILLFLLIFSLTLPFFSYADNSYIWSDQSVLANANASNQNNFDMQLESGAAILIDQKSGEVLYEYNSHEQLRPASVTKVMTILLIMEALDSGKITLEDKVPCRPCRRHRQGYHLHPLPQ